MRYLGGKGKMTQHIVKAIDDCCRGVESILDVFGGSGIVSQAFKQRGLRVISNDCLYFSYCLLRGITALNHAPSNHSQLLKQLNDIDCTNLRELPFIAENYSPNDGSGRMFFTHQNALKMDAVRQQIEQWKTIGAIDEDTYYYLLASLISAIPFVANITGTYAAYLKYWDKRAHKALTLLPCDVIDNGKENIAMNVDFAEVLKTPTDIVYADPPYNSRDYLSNYHLLETIALYDNPEIKGTSGVRVQRREKSVFCSKRYVESAFETLINSCSSHYVIISYNNEGLMDSNRLADMCRDYALPGTFVLREFDYRRYKNKIPNNNAGLREQLFIFEKR